MSNESNKTRDAHPAPWRWDDYGLLDANGKRIVYEQGAIGPDDGGVAVETPAVAELIRLAPEMEALLRQVQYGGDYYHDCPWCQCTGSHDMTTTLNHGPCPLGTLLDALDAARAAT